MNKTDLVTAIAENTKATRKASEKAIDAIISAITSELESGGKVTLVGFGSFEVKNRAARTGRNPKTKEPITIPAAKIPVFKPGKALKDAVK